jgi:hypothetical protein
MFGKRLEEITADTRTSSYDRAAWIIFLAFIAVSAFVFTGPHVVFHFSGGQGEIDAFDNRMLSVALVAEIIIFLFSFIILARASYHKYKTTRAIALLTVFGCFGIGALTLIGMAMSNMNNC